MKLYVVAHKDFSNAPSDRTVIGVGKNRALACAACYDNTGDEISEKNGSFCELTALYWIWKNTSDDDYIGLEHYRRYFCYPGRLISKALPATEIAKILTEYDAIVYKPVYFKKPLYNVYADEDSPHHLYKSDLDYCIEYIHLNYPEYSAAVQKALFEKGPSYPCNMFVMRREKLNAYCEWLFPMLFALEKKNGDISMRDAYNRRAYGFLSERLFVVWLTHQNLKLYPANVKNNGELFCKEFFSYKWKRLIGLFK